MKKGQALVILLVFMAVAITVSTTAAMILLGAQKSTTSLEVSTDAYSVAESGMENALMRLLRDPSYSGETLTVGDGIATISATGQGTTVTSTGRVGNYVRTIQVTAGYVNNILTVNTWQEVYP
jgi:hypothetical protein